MFPAKRIELVDFKLAEGALVYFGGATLAERARVDFGGATAGEATVDFGQSRFLGEFEFLFNFKEVMPLINFSGAVFLEPEHVHVYGTNLETTKFLNAKTLNRIKFSSVKWCSKKEAVLPLLSNDRKALYDEELLYKEIEKGSEEPPYEEVESLYRQLKDNYEYQRNYPDAGDFYMGEMEMRFLNPKTGRLEGLLLTLYRWLSLYGEDYRLAFIWICALIVLSGAAMLLTGFSLIYGSFKATVPNHEIALGFPELGHVLKSLLVALKMVTFQREGIVPLSSVGVLVQTLTSIFGVFLLAILGLALRRRFRR